MKYFGVLLLVAAGVARGELRIDESGRSLRISEDGKLLVEYRTDWKVPYLYPLVSPSGANVTRHWPIKDDVPEEERDHPHHRSLWLAHGAVNGYDFWAFHDGKDAKIEHVRFVDSDVDETGAARFSVDLVWTGGGRTHLTERRTHTFRRTGAETFTLQVDSELTAVEGDVLFGDSKEGMFALRLDRTLRLKGPQAKAHILNSAGAADGAAWGKRADWVAYHGPDELGEPVVVAAFDHPSNFRNPTWWHARDYGLLAANPFGIHDFENKPDKTLGDHTLPKGERLTFRYLVAIHHGDLDSADLPAIWKNFSKP